MTTILAICGFNAWMDQIPSSVLAQARERGKEVHAFLDAIDQGDLSPSQSFPPTLSGYINAYLRWRDETKFRPTLIEELVTNDEHGYLGHVDRCGYFEAGRSDRQTVVDLKCTAQVGAAVALQTEGYRLAIPQAFYRLALQLKPDGSYRAFEFKDRQDRHNWLACVRVAHFKLRHGYA